MSELLTSKENAPWLEKHYVDNNVTQFNASSGFMVKNHFAKYFQDVFFKTQIAREKPQQQCMTQLYELVLTFEHLERLISNPSSANTKTAVQELRNAVSHWESTFIEKTTDFLDSSSSVVKDQRAKKLIEKLNADIQKNTRNFLVRLDSTNPAHLRQLFAAHDLGQEMSLGHLIALNLDALLSTGLKLSYHYSPYSILNLWYVDRAIASLSNAKTDLRMQNFSLEGHMKTSAVHAYSNTILSRLNIKDSAFECYSYPAPASNPSAAERLLILSQTLKDQNEHHTNLLYQSTYWQHSLKIALAAVDTLFLSLVAINLLNYMLLKCASVLSFNYFDASISNHYQNCQRHLNWLYMCLSPLHHFQLHENQQIESHWREHGLLSDTSKDFLDASLVKSNYVQNLLQELNFNSDEKDITGISLEAFKARLGKAAPKRLEENARINRSQLNPINEFTSPAETLGEVIIFLNSGIESCFRTSPFIATAGFAASLLSFIAYINPRLVMPGCQLLMTKLQQLINLINKAFCGKKATSNLSQEVIGIFLTWQLNGVFWDLPLSLIQERLGFAEDSRHQTSTWVTKSALLAGLAYVIGQFHPINIHWPTLSPIKLFNDIYQSFAEVVLDFINLMIEEINECANGNSIFSFSTQMIITLKGSLILNSWLASGETHHLQGAKVADDATHPIGNPSESDAVSLKQYLELLMTQDQELLHLSKQAQFAQAFYLDLKQKLNTYNDTHTEATIDAQILLDTYFNLYCQSRYLNFYKLLIAPYIILSMSEFVAGHLYCIMSPQKQAHARSEIYSIRARKHLEGTVLIGIQLIYYPLYMLDTFIRMVWNYLMIGVIRAIVTLIGEIFVLFEGFNTNTALKQTQSYVQLCQIDDSISSFKIQNQLCQYLQPIYSFTASLARSTAVYNNLERIAACLLNQITINDKSERQKPALTTA